MGMFSVYLKNNFIYLGHGLFTGLSFHLAKNKRFLGESFNSSTSGEPLNKQGRPLPYVLLLLLLLVACVRSNVLLLNVERHRLAHRHGT